MLSRDWGSLDSVPAAPAGQACELLFCSPDFEVFVELPLEAAWCITESCTTEVDAVSDRPPATVTRTWDECAQLGVFPLPAPRLLQAEPRDVQRKRLLLSHPDKGGNAENFAKALELFREGRDERRGPFDAA